MCKCHSQNIVLAPADEVEIVIIDQIRCIQYPRRLIWNSTVNTLRAFNDSRITGTLEFVEYMESIVRIWVAWKSMTTIFVSLQNQRKISPLVRRSRSVHKGEYCTVSSAFVFCTPFGLACRQVAVVIVRHHDYFPCCRLCSHPEIHQTEVLGDTNRHSFDDARG